MISVIPANPGGFLTFDPILRKIGIGTTMISDAYANTYTVQIKGQQGSFPQQTKDYQIIVISSTTTYI